MSNNNIYINFSWKEVEREDKKFFNKQVVVAQENLYHKTIPTWASSFELLTRVVKL